MGKAKLGLREKLLIGILVFLILLVPFTLFSKESPPLVQVTGLAVHQINDSYQELSFQLKNLRDVPVSCMVHVSQYKYGIRFDGYVKQLGRIPPQGFLAVSVSVRLIGGETTFRIKPDCRPVS